MSSRHEENTSDLSEMKCTACRGGEPKLIEAEIAGLRPRVPEWRLVEREGIKRPERGFTFRDFAQVSDFTEKVGEQAEEEGHQPALLAKWGKVTGSSGGYTRSVVCTETTS